MKCEGSVSIQSALLSLDAMELACMLSPRVRLSAFPLAPGRGGGKIRRGSY